jgi:hypothetical protein
MVMDFSGVGAFVTVSIIHGNVDWCAWVEYRWN